ncbi:hypothetical protein LCGC14_3093010, partial [marine sediment metagenome]
LQAPEGDPGRDGEGPMPISKRQKMALCVFHDYQCEDCKVLGNFKRYKLEELEIHKINPGLGYKDHRNLKVTCRKHHEYYSSAQRIASGIQGMP